MSFVPDFNAAVWTSAAMIRVHRTVEKIGPTHLPVLITGESGTGKEIVARAVHRLSKQSEQPMIVVDCTAIPPTLMESELFGHVRGAFTGAVQSHRGLVSAADGGTFFLDEIGELPLQVQAKLLRLLQDGSYRPVGASKPKKARLRFIAATNRDIVAAVAQGDFRADLYHRLNGCHIILPPLRARRADVLPLMALHLRHFTDRDQRPPLTLDPQASHALASADWPGNVRELVNCAHYIASLAPGPIVRINDLPPQMLTDLPAPTEAEAAQPEVDLALPYKAAKRKWMDTFEDRYVIALLARHGGNVSAAARGAGMDRRSIQRMLKRIRGD